VKPAKSAGKQLLQYNTLKVSLTEVIYREEKTGLQNAFVVVVGKVNWCRTIYIMNSSDRKVYKSV